MKDPYDIVVCPIVTEKGTYMKEINQQYLFQVSRGSNKIEIRRAIESIYKVKVDKVRTLLVRGKAKRHRLACGKAPDWKKAIVTLKDGESIEFV